MLDNGIERKVPQDLLSKIPEFPKDAKLATRKAGSEALQPIAKAMPLFISGSADLHGSTLNYIKDGEDFTRDNPKGRNIRFRNSRARHVRDPEWNFLSRAVSCLGCDLYRFHRLLPCLDSVGSTGETAQYLHFHARLDRRR